MIKNAFKKTRIFVVDMAIFAYLALCSMFVLRVILEWMLVGIDWINKKAIEFVRSH